MHDIVLGGEKVWLQKENEISGHICKEVNDHRRGCSGEVYPRDLESVDP